MCSCCGHADPEFSIGSNIAVHIGCLVDLACQRPVMIEIMTSEALAALLQVVMIDLVLAGDNAVVIGLAAAGLALEQRWPA
jgi:hypothetical protein